MIGIQRILDMSMCCLWILTYTIALIGTIRYKYPLISPISQMITASFEFSVVYFFMICGSLELNYASFAYVYWSVIEVAIIYVMIRCNYIPKERVKVYLVFLSILTCVMCYLVGHQKQMFFFSYFNTFIGELIWLYHICKKDYPMKPLSLLAFMTKFIADIVAIPVYFGTSPGLIDVICITLPILDFIFIICFFIKRKNMSKIGKN